MPQQHPYIVDGKYGLQKHYCNDYKASAEKRQRPLITLLHLEALVQDPKPWASLAHALDVSFTGQLSELDAVL